MARRGDRRGSVTFVIPITLWAINFSLLDFVARLLFSSGQQPWIKVGVLFGVLFGSILSSIVEWQILASWVTRRHERKRHFQTLDSPNLVHGSEPTTQARGALRERQDHID